MENETTTFESTVRSNKDLLNDHGASGWLIVRLQRYSLLGWCLFFLLAIVFVVYLIAASSRPVPVIAVNESGQVLGSFEYLSPSARSDAEILNGAKHWLSYFYSLNSRTIFEDFTAALNMMSEDVRAKKLSEIIELGYLQQVENANTRSYVEYTDAKLISRQDLLSVVELSGKLIIDGGQSLVERPFSIRLDLESVSRSTLGQLGTAGLKIMQIVEK